jgi:8-oxo-dGTP diphosphatase
MHLLDKPFPFTYFGHNITARSLGPTTIPDISTITSVHVVPFTSEGNIVSVNIVNRGWDIPGGHVDQGESSPLDTLRREAREEASLSILEPVIVDVLALECKTLDLKTRPYMLIYVAEVAELNGFTPNDEVSQRLLMTPKMFVDSYFGNKAYAQALIDASARALMPGHTGTTLAGEGSVSNSQISQKPVASRPKSIKKKLIVLAIVAVVLLFNFPLLHMLYVKAKLATVPLPISEQVVSMGSNGLGPSGSNISFTANKSYASPLAAKEDISKQLQSAGISFPQPSDKPAYTFAQDGVNGSSDERIDNIKLVYHLNDGNDYTFLLFFEQPVLCSYDYVATETLCEGEEKGKSLTTKLVNSRHVSSARVDASIGF